MDGDASGVRVFWCKGACVSGCLGVLPCLCHTRLGHSVHLLLYNGYWLLSNGNDPRFLLMYNDDCFFCYVRISRLHVFICTSSDR